jgi:chemotaxis protein CheD
MVLDTAVLSPPRVTATAPVERHVAVADAAVARGDVRLVTMGLGSCVAIALHAPADGAGALAHAMLPDTARPDDALHPARFAATAVSHLARALRASGASGPFEARLVGGASMFEEMLPAGVRSLGARNVEAARVACRAEGIPVVAEDVGGRYGRSCWFDVADGRLLVRTVSHGERTL